MNSQRVVILIEPKHPGNIGAVCRAMANFGVDELRLVNPGCDHLGDEARRLAVFAEPLLERATVYPSLAAASADCRYAVAATRRAGHYRNRVRPLSAVAAELGAGSARTGLVFGREQSGLTTEEVMMCSHAAAIETAADGSLNLAQAVVIFLYAFAGQQRARETTESTATDGEEPLQGDFEALFATMEQVLDRTGYINRQRPEALMSSLRRIYRRAVTGNEELNLLRGIWARLLESVNDWPGRRRG